MKKNGSCFISLVDSGRFHPGVWDPSSYRDAADHEYFGRFVDVSKIRGGAPLASGFKFGPIEYRHIHRGPIPTFTLESSNSSFSNRMCSVGESCLLFGTMRAYLGNAIVTPMAAWVGEKSPLLFPVKSEFVQVSPKDGLHYFWWAFMQSPSFLQSLPVGSGGTRPRLLTDQLLNTPIQVPPRPLREKVHKMASAFAEEQWRGYMEVDRLLSSTFR